MNLDQSTPDWKLPLFHELYYSSQFMQGGRTFLDIGAHVGTWTLRLAPLFERVFAFEPDPRGYEALRKNVKLAGLKNVEVIPKAVSDKTGKLTLNLYGNPCTNSMLSPNESQRHGEAIIRTLEVDTIALDDFVAERGITDVDMVKCDAEGAEMLIVEGGLKMFHDQQPDLFLEMHGLFWRRLREQLSFMELDVIDGGRAGLSLVRHRDDWPAFKLPDYRVYPHPTEPTIADYEELRRSHGLRPEDCKAPTTGFLSVEGG
jgi:FkbM family methyltransferase